MKTITAKQFHLKPSVAYKDADAKGSVRINHDHYRDKIFILTAKARGSGGLIRDPDEIKQNKTDNFDFDIGINRSEGHRKQDGLFGGLDFIEMD